jgi:hypothetical protein
MLKRNQVLNKNVYLEKKQEEINEANDILFNLGSCATAIKPQTKDEDDDKQCLLFLYNTACQEVLLCQDAINHEDVQKVRWLSKSTLTGITRIMVRMQGF